VKIRKMSDFRFLKSRINAGVWAVQFTIYN